MPDAPIAALGTPDIKKRRTQTATRHGAAQERAASSAPRASGDEQQAREHDKNDKTLGKEEETEPDGWRFHRRRMKRMSKNEKINAHSDGYCTVGGHRYCDIRSFKDNASMANEADNIENNIVIYYISLLYYIILHYHMHRTLG